MGYPPNPSSDQPQSLDPSQQPGYPPHYPPQEPVPQGGYPPPAPSSPWQTGNQSPAAGYPGYPQQPGGPMYQSPMLQPVRQRSQLPRILISVAIIAAIVIGAIVYVISTSNGSYSTNAPGASCDKNGGFWLKNQDQGTDVSLTCQQGGILVTQTGNFNLAEPVFFGGKNDSYTFPQSYRVQIKATLVSGGSPTLVGIGVHDPIQNNLTSIGQAFQVDATGYWLAVRGDTSGNLSTVLGQGTINAPTKTMTLAVEVHGPVMVFSVNGTKVTTITDATYGSSNSVALILKGDAAAGTAASALFTQFQYTPLTGATPSASSAQATAMATTLKPYQTANPGQGCDKSGAQWATPAQFGDNDTTVTCGAQGTQVSFTATSQNISRLRFYDINGTLPQNYAIAVKADMSQLNGGCAGIYTRGSNKGTYRFFVCDDGTWAIDYIDTSGTTAQVNKLTNGQVAKQSTYTITATAVGATQSLALNGKQVSSISDSTLTTTDFVALLVLPAPSGAGAATFTNFAFTPQP